MNRRHFIGGACATVAAFSTRGVGAGESAKNRRRVAVTLDDFNVFDTPSLSGEARNEAILDALGKHKLRAVMFVAARYVEEAGKMRLLRRWDERGHLIGNHS